MADDSMDVSYSNKRTPLGVELPNDIWLSIIERLVSMSDLKALCLTSKSLRVLATPYLYDTVRIPLWKTPRVDAFFQSVGCGAGVHLGNTRTLIFEDEETPEEAICNLAGSFAFPNAPYFPDITQEDTPVSTETLEKAMDFLNAILCSPILESLHLSWIFDRPSIVISFLHPSAPNLVSFSSHASVIGRTTEMNKHELADWELFEFEKLLNHCPKLQAFGFQLPELHLQPYHRGGRVQHITVDDRFMSALRRAPDLRILHLRQSNYILEDEPRPCEQFEDDKKAWAFQTQKWANAFFAYLHERGWCPKLNSLVIRCYMLNEHEGDAVITYIPQSCYIRGFQTDTFGRSGVVAVPVTRAILRATEPCAGILDYDPETNWAIGKFAPDNEMEWG
ncbi:hypothetical protein Ptr902_12699 [Pyrenophora tritici-repentis]|nr:hypothetical protein Ptr902_12699 [Pyrenophora tritici-repentis]